MLPFESSLELRDPRPSVSRGIRPTMFAALISLVLLALGPQRTAAGAVACADQPPSMCALHPECILASDGMQCLTKPCRFFEDQGSCPGYHCVFNTTQDRCKAVPCGNFAPFLCRNITWCIWSEPQNRCNQTRVPFMPTPTLQLSETRSLSLDDSSSTDGSSSAGAQAGSPSSGWRPSGSSSTRSSKPWRWASSSSARSSARSSSAGSNASSNASASRASSSGPSTPAPVNSSTSSTPRETASSSSSWWRPPHQGGQASSSSRRSSASWAPQAASSSSSSRWWPPHHGGQASSSSLRSSAPRGAASSSQWWPPQHTSSSTAPQRTSSSSFAASRPTAPSSPASASRASSSSWWRPPHHGGQSSSAASQRASSSAVSPRLSSSSSAPMTPVPDLASSSGGAGGQTPGCLRTARPCESLSRGLCWAPECRWDTQSHMCLALPTCLHIVNQSQCAAQPLCRWAGSHCEAMPCASLSTGQCCGRSDCDVSSDGTCAVRACGSRVPGLLQYYCPRTQCKGSGRWCRPHSCSAYERVDCQSTAGCVFAYGQCMPSTCWGYRGNTECSYYYADGCGWADGSCFPVAIKDVPCRSFTTKEPCIKSQRRYMMDRCTWDNVTSKCTTALDTIGSARPCRDFINAPSCPKDYCSWSEDLGCTAEPLCQEAETKKYACLERWRFCAWTGGRCRALAATGLAVPCSGYTSQSKCPTERCQWVGAVDACTPRYEWTPDYVPAARSRCAGHALEASCFLAGCDWTSHGCADFRCEDYTPAGCPAHRCFRTHSACLQRCPYGRQYSGVTMSCDAAAPRCPSSTYQCWDGSCRRSPTLCPRRYDGPCWGNGCHVPACDPKTHDCCGALAPHRCRKGSHHFCTVSEAMCDELPECPKGLRTRCWNGACVAGPEVCPCRPDETADSRGMCKTSTPPTQPVSCRLNGVLRNMSITGLDGSVSNLKELVVTARATWSLSWCTANASLIAEVWYYDPVTYQAFTALWWTVVPESGRFVIPRSLLPPGRYYSLYVYAYILTGPTRPLHTQLLGGGAHPLLQTDAWALRGHVRREFYVKTPPPVVDIIGGNSRVVAAGTDVVLSATTAAADSVSTTLPQWWCVGVDGIGCSKQITAAVLGAGQRGNLTLTGVALELNSFVILAGVDGVWSRVNITVGPTTYSNLQLSAHLIGMSPLASDVEVQLTAFGFDGFDATLGVPAGYLAVGRPMLRWFSGGEKLATTPMGQSRAATLTRHVLQGRTKVYSVVAVRDVQWKLGSRPVTVEFGTAEVTYEVPRYTHGSCLAAQPQSLDTFALVSSWGSPWWANSAVEYSATMGPEGAVGVALAPPSSKPGFMCRAPLVRSATVFRVHVSVRDAYTGEARASAVCHVTVLPQTVLPPEASTEALMDDIAEDVQTFQTLPALTAATSLAGATAVLQSEAWRVRAADYVLWSAAQCIVYAGGAGNLTAPALRLSIGALSELLRAFPTAPSNITRSATVLSGQLLRASEHHPASATAIQSSFSLLQRLEAASATAMEGSNVATGVLSRGPAAHHDGTKKVPSSEGLAAVSNWWSILGQLDSLARIMAGTTPLGGTVAMDTDGTATTAVVAPADALGGLFLSVGNLSQAGVDVTLPQSLATWVARFHHTAAVGAVSVVSVGSAPSIDGQGNTVDVASGVAEVSLLLGGSKAPVMDLTEGIDLRLPIRRLGRGPHNVTCAYYDHEAEVWSTDGVDTVTPAADIPTNGGMVHCRSSHLSTFAVLAAPHQPPPVGPRTNVPGELSPDSAGSLAGLGDAARIALICVAVAVTVAAIAAITGAIVRMQRAQDEAHAKPHHPGDHGDHDVVEMDAMPPGKLHVPRPPSDERGATLPQHPDNITPLPTPRLAGHAIVPPRAAGGGWDTWDDDDLPAKPHREMHYADPDSPYCIGPRQGRNPLADDAHESSGADSWLGPASKPGQSRGHSHDAPSRTSAPARRPLPEEL